MIYSNLISMKTLFKSFILSLILLISFTELEAQPQKIGYSDSYTSIAADTSLADLNYQYFGNATTFTVGVLYTKGAEEDDASTIEVYHALIPGAANAITGNKISVDSLLRYDNSAESEYKEQTFTLASGIGYINIYYNKAATATDTFTLAPRIYIKPK